MPVCVFIEGMAQALTLAGQLGERQVGTLAGINNMIIRRSPFQGERVVFDGIEGDYTYSIVDFEALKNSR